MKPDRYIRYINCLRGLARIKAWETAEGLSREGDAKDFVVYVCRTMKGMTGAQTQSLIEEAVETFNEEIDKERFR